MSGSGGAGRHASRGGGKVQRGKESKTVQVVLTGLGRLSGCEEARVLQAGWQSVAVLCLGSRTGSGNIDNAAKRGGERARTGRLLAVGCGLWAAG